MKVSLLSLFLAVGMTAAEAFPFGSSLANLTQTKPAHAQVAEGYQPGLNKVTFQSEGIPMVGSLYLPSSYKPGNRLPAIVVTGSWTTVKEQMAGTYAQKVADQGQMATLAFDFRFFGESGGTPRYYESPDRKIQDIKNAVAYLQTLPMVNPEQIGGLGICASAGYMAAAAATDENIKSLALVAPWLHNAELVRAVYGGEEGVQKRIQEGLKAREKYEQTGQIDYVPAISVTDPNAAMFGEFDYYLNPLRGAIPQWGNQFALMSWPEWLEFDAIQLAAKIKTPTLMVHSQEGAIPTGAEQFFAQLSAPKEQVWLKGATQFDFYDQTSQVNQAVASTVQHLKKSL